MRSPWSPVQILTKLPHEQLNVAHQILGRIITLLFCLHGSLYLYFFSVSGLLVNRLGNRVVILGLVGLFLFIFMSSTALGYLRTRSYRVFFAVHITSAPILPVVLFWHISHLRTYIWEVLGVYVLTMITRSRNICTYPGTISLVPGTNLIKMDMLLASGATAMQWKPGQHVHVSLPVASKASPAIKNLIRQRYRTNPFTIASLPHEDGGLTLVARTLNRNTKKLAALARSFSDQAEDDKSTPPINITIEGPYGASSRLPDLASYDYVLLLAGGVGATFILPVFRSITSRSHWPSPAAANPQIRFVWMVRRLAEVRWAFPTGADAGDPITNVESNAAVEVYVTQTGQGLGGEAEGGDLEMAEGANLLHTGDEAEKIGGSEVNHGRPDLKRIVDDVTLFEDVFATYRTGDVDQVKASLARLTDEHAKYLRKSLAVLALQDRRSGILKLCLDQGGFAFEHYFVDAADKFQNASDDPETFKVLEESKMRELYPRSAPHTEEDSEEESEGEEDPSEVFDEGEEIHFIFFLLGWLGMLAKLIRQTLTSQLLKLVNRLSLIFRRTVFYTPSYVPDHLAATAIEQGLADDRGAPPATVDSLD
ncbi:hypothetical protein H2199_007561 [Coniosporium tulheliwenetii]|uniref:Uncharacterized protein n=1 Tax=Coniosporium tulheliwenetii TaxID=3383036 RepID=A0ACC2YPM6_9PEZI|nr:hypothetical protein H2199_007561 [Cladosporium sp. JES 115]